MNPTQFVRRFVPACLALTAACLAVVLAGCGGGGRDAAVPADGKPTEVKVAYLGLTCEAPLFVAHEKGMFKEEGLDVEMVKTDWDGLREGLSAGRFDISHTLVMYILKAVEAGGDLKITGGVHTGCLRVQVGVDSGVKTVADLKGKRIGVPTHIGSPPYMFACRTLAAAGIDPSQEAKQVTWVTFPPDVLGKALQDGRIDALATSDPVGTILLGKNIVRTIADQATDQPYSDEFCCATVVSGQIAAKRPADAAKLTRAILKAAKWVEANPKAAAELAVEKKYIAASAEINTQALTKLRYIPAVAKCKTSVEQAAVDMKKAKLLKDTTDPVAMAKRAWVDLDGVTDAWVTAQAVERVPGSGRPVILPAAEFAALFDGPKGSDRCACCNKCCIE